MENQKEPLDSLKEKLQAISSPDKNEILEIKLSKKEALVYDLESNDILSADEIKLESEGEDE